jgi:hypothetical protein
LIWVTELLCMFWRQAKKLCQIPRCLSLYMSASLQTVSKAFLSSTKYANTSFLSFFVYFSIIVLSVKIWSE